jgi:RNA polymerase sigma-70 factor (ECF subfamily)
MAASASERETLPSRAEDRALAARMCAGDERALNELVEQYSSPLYRFSLARLDGDSELASETVQTALAKAIARIDSYRGESSLLTWLCACCRNEILMLHRRRRTEPSRVELDEDVQPAAGSPTRRATDPESHLLRIEAARLVHTTLDLLPPRYAQALEWKYVEQLSVVEIADRLEVRPKAAESLLTRARDAFRAGYRSVAADTDPRALAASPAGRDREEES